MLRMLEVDPATGRSGHDRAKRSAPRATVTKLRQQLDHLAWLDGSAGAGDAWLKGVPASGPGSNGGKSSGYTPDLRRFSLCAGQAWLVIVVGSHPMRDSRIGR
ncbi:hypothetical protein [Streptosporangium roseum]|uniref:hypothetical protein n=1 Tax=Streptosporangium roseum TaxID=2001 RepID=UPI0011D23754|nr:hypothetical protein [Streptosporangium roseum]